MIGEKLHERNEIVNKGGSIYRVLSPPLLSSAGLVWKGMVTTKGCAKSHPRRRRAVPRLGFGQDDVRFEFRGVRCGLPTTRPQSFIWLSGAPRFLMRGGEVMH